MMMTNKEKYQQAFSVLHASDHISLEMDKERNGTKGFRPGRKLATACMCAVLALSTGFTAYAAYHFLTPSQVVSELYGSSSIAEAFEGETAILMNESVESSDYVITLLGMTSGTGLTKYVEDGEQIEKNETYAVLAIEKRDGTAMPEIAGVKPDEQQSILVTPFIGGEEPWKINIYSLEGGYTEFVRDGILYRLISCKNLEVFADRGVYIGVCKELADINQAFVLDTETGCIETNPEFDGLHALFKLPLKESGADNGTAETALNQP